MCAIFGIVGKYDKDEAVRYFNTLAHRGEDESGFVCGENLFLGSHRLAITNIQTKSPQPFEMGGYRIVFNGEIYNYEELGRELKCPNANEEEVILEAYKRYGDDMVSYIRGMYAIAIYENQKLKLFRDKIGKKPLFYRLVDDAFWFASEIKALKSSAVRYEALNSYLSFQSTISPDTFFDDIYSLEAGSVVEFCDGKINSKKTFSPLDFQVVLDTKESAIIATRDALLKSVNERISQVPFGVLLSGGVDSSLVASILSKNQRIDTYCVGYEEEYSQYDERRYANIVSRHIGSNHTEVVFTKEQFYKNLETTDRYFDSPLGDPAVLPLLGVMEAIKSDGKKVVITGDGADELFLGYKTYKEFYDLENLAKLKQPNWLLNHLKGHFSQNKEWEWHKRALEKSLLFRSTAELFTDLQQNRLMRRNTKDNSSQKLLQKYRDEVEGSGRASELDWYSFCDIKVKLGELFLAKLDRVSMIHGLEARSPFLDELVLKCAFGISPDIKFGDKSKSIIKEIASEYLPSEIIDRKKRGFSYPYMEWLIEENELELIRKVNSKHKIFVNDEVDFLLQSAKTGGFKHQVFALYNYCRWLDKR